MGVNKYNGKVIGFYTLESKQDATLVSLQSEVK